jgi:mannose-6-phosphate isomerase-like protein (cupin superfamily)
MKEMAGGCRVFESGDGEISTVGNWTSRPLIRRATGAKQITQTVSEYTQGLSPTVVNPNAEEVLYTAGGEGVCYINGFSYDLRPGTGVYVPPGAPY